MILPAAQDDVRLQNGIPRLGKGGIGRLKLERVHHQFQRQFVSRARRGGVSRFDV